MLKKATLKNFRQHELLEVDFSAGNTVIRGANEAGKSTLIEAVLYAMGGVKQCRNSDIVRWGAKASQCKVEVLWGEARVTRGPSGAEVYLPAGADKPLVTGQSEVTAWFAEQLGTSMDMACKMMFAGQKEIGGLLDSTGNSKVVEFIESMSGLDIVDKLIGAVKQGPTGDTKFLSAQLEQLLEQLVDMKLVDHSKIIAQTEQEIATVTQTLNLLQPKIDEQGTQRAALVEQLTSLRDYAASLASFKTRVISAQEAVDEATVSVDTAQKQVDKLRPDVDIEAEIAAIEAAAAGERENSVKRRAFAALAAWPAPDAEWEGSLDSLKKFISGHSEAANTLSQTIQTANMGIEAAKAAARRLRASVVKLGQKCPTCKQVIPDLEGVASHNEELEVQAKAEEAKIGPLSAEIDQAQASLQEHKENVAAGREIADSSVFPGLAQYPDWFAEVVTHYPPRVQWIGGDVPDQRELESPEPPRQELLQNTRVRSRLESAKEGALTADANLAGWKTRLAEKEAQAPEGDPEQIQPEIAKITTALSELNAKQAGMRESLAASRATRLGLIASQEAAAAKHKQMTADVDRVQGEIESMEFNNKLIDSLQRARPAVANELWSMVLKGVSTYLTSMRGEASIVTREGKTFLVNGKPYTSYSGSALDLLALGIRIALAKVFVPGADLIILDEPFAACTPERTLQGLGLVRAAGFSQAVVITHEGSTEDVFDNILEM